MTWTWTVVVAIALVVVGALYIRQRWHRSPQAYRAMIALAGCYFVAGSLTGAWLLHLTTTTHVEARAASANVTAPTSATAVGASEAINALSKFSAEVVSITDGDTVDVLTPGGLTYVVRLAGIDAPEHDQVFGSQSTASLAALVSGKSVMLECENERSYGRLICKILLPNGEDACLDQVKAGMAWHYKQYQDEQNPADREAYARVECAAMKGKIGLWSDPHPVQPLDFRHDTHSELLFGPDGCRISGEPTSGAVVGNSRSHIFEWPSCPYYSSISPDNRVPFPNPQAAEQAGYRPAHNCP
jgi:endonuclease YncB( thermonuclease family)